MIVLRTRSRRTHGLGWLGPVGMGLLLALVPAYAPSVRAAEAEAAFDVRPGFTVIDSLPELRRTLAASGQKIRMKPGTYRITSAENQKMVFNVSGSNNHFDLRGVNLQLETQVLAAMRGKVHELCVWRTSGSNLTFEGAVFEDVGNEPPYQSLSDFGITGNNNTFRNCTFIVRGSAPYGYGDLFGKGAGAKVRLQKHAAMSVHGDNARIVGCRFEIHTFGHAIHMHGAQNTVIEDVSIEGELRLTDEILAEKEGPAVKFGYKDQYGRPIPRGVMLALAEDGIRAYLDGGRERPQPRTGDITVTHCTVKRMRGGITLSLASGQIAVRGCTVTESGSPGCTYSVPSNGLIRDCRGDSPYVPLLHLGYSHKQKADIELEWIDTVRPVGNDLLALVNGSGHRITITQAGGAGAIGPRLQKIALGQTYRADEADVGITAARHVELDNRTPHAVELTPLSSDCTVRSVGPVTDHGKDNTVLPVPNR